MHTQKIIVFQQNGSGEAKLRGIRKYGEDLFDLEIVSIDEFLPCVIDDSQEYLPCEIQADLVLDFLRHPDLSYDLAEKCCNENIPVVASGKKLRIKGAFIPPIWCALSRQGCLGNYGERFGTPEFEVETGHGRIVRINVLRGAPCGATWEAAAKVEGMPIEEAIVRIGLETQFFCGANPAGWDPIYGKSPVHLAGEIHSAGVKRALKGVI